MLKSGNVRIVNLIFVVALALLCLVIVGCSVTGTANARTQSEATPTPENSNVTKAAERPTSSAVKNRIEPSSVLDDITNYKRENKDIPSKDLADFGNTLLPTHGFNFDIDLASVVEKKIAARNTKPVKKEGDDSLFVSFPLELLTERGTKKIFEITALGEASCCCGYYYTPFPITQITKQRMTIVVDGKPYLIRRNRDFPVVQEYILYENLKKPKKIRSWEVPYETYPYGLSKDGMNLYIDLDTENLLLEISNAGSLRFVAKDTEGIINNGEDLRKLPPPKVGEVLNKSGEFGLMRYKLENKEYVVEFPYPCT